MSCHSAWDAAKLWQEVCEPHLRVWEASDCGKMGAPRAQLQHRDGIVAFIGAVRDHVLTAGSPLLTLGHQLFGVENKGVRR
jgi:hypothetical protein